MYIIAYPAGCYGNFIGFTLDWMQGNYAVDYRPFTKKIAVTAIAVITGTDIGTVTFTKQC